MNDPLTPECRAELRRTLDLLIPARYEAMNMPTAEILALLDAADERDKLAAAVERVRALAPVDVSDWDEDDPLMVCAADLHRALDG